MQTRFFFFCDVGRFRCFSLLGGPFLFLYSSFMSSDSMNTECTFCFSFGGICM